MTKRKDAPVRVVNGQRVSSAPFGERLRAMRKARGLKIRDLAARLGLSTGAVNHWELDDAAISVPQLQAICRALSCAIEVSAHGVQVYPLEDHHV